MITLIDSLIILTTIKEIINNCLSIFCGQAIVVFGFFIMVGFVWVILAIYAVITGVW